jgi:hypothetical protein
MMSYRSRLAKPTLARKHDNIIKKREDEDKRRSGRLQPQPYREKCEISMTFLTYQINRSKGPELLKLAGFSSSRVNQLHQVQTFLTVNSCSVQKLENHTFSAFRDYSFSISSYSPLLEIISSIWNLRKCHAVVTRCPLTNMRATTAINNRSICPEKCAMR